MDKTKDTGTWLKFFKDAGIPTKTGASYAHIFVENRIHKDMLSDLTVDHLRLMGINLIGDIIAILRHAKSVHQDSLRKVVILKSKDDPPESSSSSSSSSKSGSSSSSSSSSDSEEDVEMVEITKPARATKKLVSSASRTIVSKVKKEPVPLKEDSRKLIRSKVINNTSSASLSKSTSGSERSEPQKRKYYENEQAMEVDLPVKKTVVKTSNSSTNTGRSILKAPDEPVKKMRATGGNEFIGPKLPPPKKTVFDRLGAETGSPQVSSTTEVSRTEVEPRFTRTIGNVSMPVEPKIVANIDIPPPKSSSVFNRLGGVTSEPPAGPALPYAGVLKSPQIVKGPLLNVSKKIVTMRADEPEVPVKLRAATRPSMDQNIKMRVGETSFKAKPKLNRASLTNGRFTNPASEGIFANPKNALQLNAKARLGLQSQQKSLNKSAKARLGLQSRQNALNSSGKPRLGLVEARKPLSQGIKQSLGAKRLLRTQQEDKLEWVKGLGSKKVSFGGVDRKFISPMKSARGGRNMKSGIHSRLGTRNFT